MNIEDELEKILKEGNIATVFQPIVSLNDASVIGYEALSRGPEKSDLFSPEKLFFAAEQCNRTWELDFLCRTKAIEKSRMLEKDKYLFVNVDPKILKDEKFKKGFTKEFLEKNNISPDSIIFEITEKTAIEDYESFKNTLSNYVEQGYKIAIDDIGVGYSGLNTLLQTKPHYIKIDMSLVHDIDKDSFKQELMKTFVTLSKATNMNIIAEGIETKDELITLINLGVYAVQGFFLQRPAGTFLDIPQNIKDIIINSKKFIEGRLEFSQNCIGDIAIKVPSFSLNSANKDIKNFFDSSSATGVCIVKDDYPIGLIMRHNLDSTLATQYGVAVFMKRPVSLTMDYSPLIVDYYDSITSVSKTAMNREAKKVYDYVIITRDRKYYGIVTIKNLLEYTTEFEKNYAKNLNPLTGLPGNEIINKKLIDMFGYKHDFCVLYVDLNNFKIYNDCYGFENGDKILRFTSDLLQNELKKQFPYNSFLGHIGGDDFVIIIESAIEKCYKFCNTIISEFDSGILNFFNEKDKNNGFIKAIDRKGNMDSFPLTAIAIGGMYGSFKAFNDAEQIGEYMGALKKEAKKNKNSSYIISKTLDTCNLKSPSLSMSSDS